MRKILASIIMCFQDPGFNDKLRLLPKAKLPLQSSNNPTNSILPNPGVSGS